MDEPLFMCAYPFDEKHSDEVLSYIYFHSWQLMLFLWVGVAGAVLTTAASIVMYCTSGRIPAVAGTVFVLFIFMIAVHLFNYSKIKKSQRLRIRELYNGNPGEVKADVYADRLEYCTGAQSEPTVLHFGDIKKVFETKNALVAQSRAQLLYVLEKTGFTKGTPEDCAVFLRGHAGLK